VKKVKKTVAKKVAKKAVKTTAKRVKAKPKAKEKPDLSLVEKAAPFVIDPNRKQTIVTKDRRLTLDVVPIPGLLPGELEAILKREGIRESYEDWSTVNPVMRALSSVGGIASVTVVSETVKTILHRGATWANGRCVSLDGGITRLARDDEEAA
jgi:hypothetical protein